MPEEIRMKIIARIHTDFPTKFGIPRQSGLVEELKSYIVFEPEYRDENALRGIEQFSHLWLIWQFSEAVRSEWSPTVRPPRLGGNTRMGVFATRSPFRPNAIGLSSVKLLGLEETKNHGTVIHVAGADLMDGTPILDIKPYIPYSDTHIDATGGFTDHADNFLLQVQCNQDLLKIVPPDKQEALLDVLSHDPRPTYQKDSDRIYGLDFAGYNVRFTINSGILQVIQIEKL